MSAPAGYVPYHRSSPYLDLVGPLYEATSDPSRVRIQIDGRHTNARGWAHGGVLLAVADTLMGHTAQRAGPEGTSVVTVSMTTDFPGTARMGDWVEAIATVRRLGRRLAFTRCEFTAGERLVLTATGVFAIVERTGGRCSEQ
jgi:uncharacterized protein (TIGR00369 family)